MWSPDGEWIYFDIRSDRHGSTFDGSEIRRVHWQSGSEEIVYQTRDGSCCGVVLCHPREEKIVFIHGPSHPNAAWNYGAARRCGVLLTLGEAFPEILDARDLIEPFTPGSHRGGSHVHQFSPQGDWVSFTYEDEYLDSLARQGTCAEANQRNIGIAVPGERVSVRPRHPRNQSGGYYSLICTHTCDQPKPGSDEIQRAYEESWLDGKGQQAGDGSLPSRRLVFLGDILSSDGKKVTELFVVDLPENVVDCDRNHRARTDGKEKRLEPCPEIQQRRLTYLLDGYEPGLQGIRFWPRSTPDGVYVFVLKKDRQGVVQFWRVHSKDGRAEQWTSNSYDVSSAFSLSGDGKWIAHTMRNAICVTSCLSGSTIYLTEPFGVGEEPLPEAVVWNPLGNAIAFVRPQLSAGRFYNQIFVLDVDRAALDHFL